jgi:nucleotide-binding universal stress UspA family protein
MSIRTMLVHVDNGVRCRARVDAAVLLARDLRARLIGAYLVSMAEMLPSVAAMVPEDVLQKHLRATAEAQESAEAVFRDAIAQAAFEPAEWRAPAGDPLQAAITHGRCCDLVVLGQCDPEDPAALFTSDLLTAALFGLGRPMLIVPYTGTEAILGKRILVATDGGREATRAIGDAMPLLERAAAVNVLIGTSSEPEAPTFAQSSLRIGAWLRDHAIEPVIERYDPEATDKGEWLLSRAADFGADLVVMGGYGHPRVREMVLGGMTRTLLRSMTVPVLMSH